MFQSIFANIPSSNIASYAFITVLDWRLKRNRLSRRHTSKKKKRNCKHPIFQELNISIKESDIGAKRQVFIHTLFLRQQQNKKEHFYPFISDLGHDEVVGTHTSRCYVFIHFLFLREGKKYLCPDNPGFIYHYHRPFRRHLLVMRSGYY